MPPPGIIALVLAIACIRSQRKLSNAAKTYQRYNYSHSAQLASFSVASDSGQ